MGASVVLLLLVVWQRYKGLIMSPSNHRQWTKDQETLQEAVFHGDTVTIRNLRDLAYLPGTKGDEYEVRHLDKTFDLSKLTRLWYMHSVFGPLAAHTIFSFEFEDGSFLPISIEIRKCVGQKFGLVLGWGVLYRPIELMYIAATESDLIRARLCEREGETVSLYEMHVPQEVLRPLLTDMLTRMNDLCARPVFYDLIAENCTSLPLWHLRKAWKESGLPFWHHSYLFTARSPELLKKVGLIRKPLNINPKEICPLTGDAFSHALRSASSAR